MVILKMIALWWLVFRLLKTDDYGGLAHFFHVNAFVNIIRRRLEKHEQFFDHVFLVVIIEVSGIQHCILELKIPSLSMYKKKTLGHNGIFPRCFLPNKRPSFYNIKKQISED